MIDTSENLPVAYGLRDGGTGAHVGANEREAFATVHGDDRRRAYFALLAAGLTVLFLALTRLVWLFSPLFDMIYYGLLSEIIYYIILILLCVGWSIFIHHFVKRKCDIRVYARKQQPLGIWRTLAAIGVAALFVFVVSAILGFKFKAQNEMGMGVTLNQALTNIAVYFYYGVHMWLGFTAAVLVQYGASTLLPTKYTVPWGSIFLVALYGVIELLFEYATTNHMYAGYYYLFTYAYAIIFALTARRFHVSYWTSFAVMIL